MEVSNLAAGLIYSRNMLLKVCGHTTRSRWVSALNIYVQSWVCAHFFTWCEITLGLEGAVQETYPKAEKGRGGNIRGNIEHL